MIHACETLCTVCHEDAAFTIAAPKYWNSVPDDLQPLKEYNYHIVLLTDVDYIHIGYHYNVFF